MIRPLRWIGIAVAFVVDWLVDLMTFAEGDTPNEVREAIVAEQESARFAPRLTSVAEAAPAEVREPEKPKFRVRPPKLPDGATFTPSVVGAVDEKTGQQGYHYKRRINPRRQGKKALKRIGASAKEVKRTERAHRRLGTWRCNDPNFPACKDRVPHRHVRVVNKEKPSDD